MVGDLRSKTMLPARKVSFSDRYFMYNIPYHWHCTGSSWSSWTISNLSLHCCISRRKCPRPFYQTSEMNHLLLTISMSAPFQVAVKYAFVFDHFYKTFIRMKWKCFSYLVSARVFRIKEGKIRYGKIHSNSTRIFSYPPPPPPSK